MLQREILLAIFSWPGADHAMILEWLALHPSLFSKTFSNQAIVVRNRERAISKASIASLSSPSARDTSAVPYAEDCTYLRVEYVAWIAHRGGNRPLFITIRSFMIRILYSSRKKDRSSYIILVRDGLLLLKRFTQHGSIHPRCHFYKHMMKPFWTLSELSLLNQSLSKIGQSLGQVYK